MKFNKYLAGGVFLISASFSLPSFAGVNSASVSITVIPKNVTLSCYQGYGGSGCSVNLPAGLRSGSTVTVGYYTTATLGWCDYGNSKYYKTRTSGVTESGKGACVNAKCNETTSRVYSYMYGLSVGSTNVGVYVRPSHSETRYCNEQDGGQSPCGYDDIDSCENTYTFTVTY